MDDVGTMLATFIDPTGVEWPLSNTSDDLGWFTTQEIAGWGARPFEFSLDPLPRGGEDVRFIRPEAARITWPIHIWGSTYIEFTDRYRELRKAIMSTVHLKTPGILRVRRPDGTAREIDVLYEDGFGGQGGENWIYANPVITFLAPDGYWRDTAPIEVWREYAAANQSFLSPFPSVSSGQVLGITEVVNPGDTEAYPLWTVQGPMAALTATNHTTGHEFVLTFSLASNAESITITTDRPMVRGPAGQNIVGSLNWPDAYLWSLLPGQNDVEFVVSGPSSGTRITLSYYPRYNGV